MTLVLTILHIIVCFMLIIVILVQGGRGQGLSGPSFSSGNVQSLFGTQAADFLTKATSVSAILFLFTCIGLNFFETRKSKSLLEGHRQMAPVDIDAVKKALEKVKAEKTASSAAAKNEVSALVDTAKKSVDDAAAKTQKAAADVNAVVTKKAEELKANAPTIPAAPTNPAKKESAKS